MTKNDLPGVEVVEQTTKTPWSANLLAAELEQIQGFRYVCRSPDSPKILGFIIGTIICDEAEIRKIAVLPEYRRKMIASSLLDASFSLFKDKKVANCFLELRESNGAALGLYQKKGFTMVGRRKGYYSFPTEDALIMKKDIGVSHEKH